MCLWLLGLANLRRLQLMSMVVTARLRETVAKLLSKRALTFIGHRDFLSRSELGDQSPDSKP
jgi:hypothetical protein